MLRFVDLRFSLVGQRFAFWDTRTSSFQSFSGAQAWTTFAEFEADLLPAVVNPPVPLDMILARYRGLCPPWAFQTPGEDEEQLLYGAPDNPPVLVGMRVADRRTWTVEWINHYPDADVAAGRIAAGEQTWVILRCGTETLRRPLNRLTWNPHDDAWEVC